MTGINVGSHSDQSAVLLTVILDEKKVDGKDEEKIVGKCPLLLEIIRTEWIHSS